ncbi:MAG TPA: hypothetical protein VM390_10045, partial [Acidimicrobiales bacterium]|nr:hypothetical protein [Acidimicrobiales bacterium]
MATTNPPNKNLLRALLAVTLVVLAVGVATVVVRSGDDGIPTATQDTTTTSPPTAPADTTTTTTVAAGAVGGEVVVVSWVAVGMPSSPLRTTTVATP